MKKFLLFLLIPSIVFGQKINRNVNFTSVALPSISNLITDFDFSNQNAVVTYHNKVTQITDAVGSVISSQSDTTKQPVYHYNGGSGNNAYATFTGGQKLTGNLLTSSTDFTMVIVRRVDASSSSYGLYGVFSNGNTSSNGYAWCDMQTYVHWGNTSGGYYPGVTSNESSQFLTSTGRWEVCVLSHSSGNTKIYNTLGTKLLAHFPASNPITPTGGHIIGQVPGSSMFIGDISRILLYDRQLTDAEVITLTTALTARYINPLPGMWNAGGDSITATAQGDLYYCYPMYTFQGLISTKYFYLLKTAVTGRTAQNVLDSLNSEVIDRYQSRVKCIYSILIGHNGLASNHTPAGIDTVYNQTLRICSRAKAAGYRVILETVLNTTVYPQSVTDTINNRYRNRWHTMAVDTLLDINVDPHLLDPTNTVYFFDGQTHLSLIGAQRVDSLIRPIINTYLN